MVNQIISEILYETKNGMELREALYQVLSKYEIAEKTAEIRTIDKTWQKKNFRSFLREK